MQVRLPLPGYDTSHAPEPVPALARPRVIVAVRCIGPEAAS